VGGFGLSRELDEDSMTMSMIGTKCYLSPEMAFGFPYNYKIDIWSIGIMLYAMLFFAFPFGNHSS
jgi:serine/threonine protein kinase